jgi:hypothetical protein
MRTVGYYYATVANYANYARARYEKNSDKCAHSM